MTVRVPDQGFVEVAGLAAELPPGAVELFAPVASAQAAGILRAADALLVPLAATPGLDGFVLKDSECAALVGAIRQVGTGAPHVDPPLAPAFLRRRVRPR